MAIEPPCWVLVFTRYARARWMERIVPGRYKHVRAYAWCPLARVWLFYDVHLTGTSLYAVPDGMHRPALAEFTRDADLIAMPRVARAALRGPRLGFWCVPAMKHLVGLRSGTLRPSALFRDCLAAGGIPQIEAADAGKCADATASSGSPGPAVRHAAA